MSAPIAELSSVSKSYRGARGVAPTSLSVDAGEMVAIVGESGSGKTTILNLLGLLERPDRGEIRLFGNRAPKPKTMKADRLLRTRIGYLFQNFALIDGATVDYNLRIAQQYARGSASRKREQRAEALQKVGLDGFGSKKVFALSGGEQQRVAIARLLLKPCELILADEPTGSLDPRNRDEILGILHGLNEAGKTIVIVTHDAQIATSCHRSLQLSRAESA